MEILIYLKTLFSYFMQGPMIIPIPGTNVAKIPVWHRGQYMAVYVPIRPDDFEYGSINYVDINDDPLEATPVPGIDIPLTPAMFNAEKVSLYNVCNDDITTYTNHQEFFA